MKIVNGCILQRNYGTGNSGSGKHEQVGDEVVQPEVFCDVRILSQRFCHIESGHVNREQFIGPLHACRILFAGVFRICPLGCSNREVNGRYDCPLGWKRLGEDAQ